MGKTIKRLNIVNQSLFQAFSRKPTEKMHKLWDKVTGNAKLLTDFQLLGLTTSPRYWLLYSGPRSAGQTMWQNHFKSIVQAFFQVFKNSFNISAFRRTYTTILTPAIGQCQSAILANRFNWSALMTVLTQFLSQFLASIHVHTRLLFSYVLCEDKQTLILSLLKATTTF